MIDIILQAAPKRTNESVLAMQPPQADQPEGGSGNGGQLSSKFGNSGNQSWATMTIAVSIFIAVVVILLAVAPVTKYIKFRPLLSHRNMPTSQSGPMRLVGKSYLLHHSNFFFFLFFFHIFRCDLLLRLYEISTITSKLKFRKKVNLH